VAEVDILEVRRVGESAAQMGAAVEHLRAAQAAMAEGAAERAVGTCRKALEAVAGAGSGDPWARLDRLFAEAAGSRVGNQYSKILRALKQITGEDHHHYGSETKFTRSEAQFVLRCVSDLVALIGALHEQAQAGTGGGGDADQNE
jgi:DNA-binding FadR family transcriptional regulator